MKIENAQIYLGSSHQYAQHHEINESLTEGINKPGTAWSAENLEQGTIYQRQETHEYLELSAEAQLMQLAQSVNKNPENLASLQNKARQLGAESPVTMPAIEPPKITQGIIPADTPTEIAPADNAKLLLLIAMIEAITGKKIEFITPQSV